MLRRLNIFLSFQVLGLQHANLHLQLCAGVLLTNMLGVLLPWQYSTLVLAVIHLLLALATSLLLPRTPHQVASSPSSPSLSPAPTKCGPPLPVSQIRED